MRYLLGTAAAAALFAVATPAAAQTSVSENGVAKGTVLQPLTLTKASDLDFGTIVASTTAGWVKIDATLAGDRTVDGTGVTEVLSADGGSGKFSGVGTPNTDVDLSLTYDPVLYNSNADPLTVTDMYLANGGVLQTVTTDAADGSFNTYVGGEFAIAANQAPGVYSGDFVVTAIYP